MENWNFESVKPAEGTENLSAAQREEAVQEQYNTDVVTPAEPEEPQGYQTPTNDDGDFVVNIDNPPNLEDNAIQEREAETVDVGERAPDSQEVEQEVRVEPSQEHSAPEETPVSTDDTSDDFGIVEVDAENEVQPEQTSAEENIDQAIDEIVDNDIELPEGIDKLVNFINETGGTLQDYMQLNQDVDNMNPVDAVREYYRQKYPHYDEARVERKMQKEFQYDPDMDDEDLIQDRKDAFSDALYEAQSYLKSNKEKYYAELKANPRNVAPEYQEAMNFYQTQKQQDELSQKQIADFHKMTDDVFNDEFKGFDFKIGDKKFRVKVGDVAKTKEFQKSLDNFVGDYIKDGKVTNVAQYHKALYAARNVDKLAQHFYEQGRADAIKNSAAQAKNIDMKPRQDAASIVTPSGQKFRVVSGDSSNKLKIKMRK